ncbi:MAG TPA: hypothetical protein VGY76_05300 [Solirubrobacteraceae bacterium]|jgi:hypothetical protein|nr:hypothetical protein [Solirubrobacteraceae bacterium]
MMLVYRHMPMLPVINDQIDGPEDAQMLNQHEAAIARAMDDPQQAASYRAELDIWDGSLLDGLKDLT